MPLVFCSFFYGHSMESLSAINLYGQLMNLMVLCIVIQCFSRFSIMALYETPVFALWHHLDLMFFSIMAYCEPNDYSQFYLFLWLHVFPEPMTFRNSRLHASRPGC